MTLARWQTITTGTLFYRRSLGTGGVELNTLAQLKTDLGLTGTNSGDISLTTNGTNGAATLSRKYFKYSLIIQ